MSSRCITCPVYGRTGVEEAQKPRWAEHGWLACTYCQDRLRIHLRDIPAQYSMLDATPGSAPMEARVRGGEETLGVRLVVLDLIAPASTETVHDPEHDQTGHVPVAATLDSWVADWITERDQGEHRPVPTVHVLSQWLLNRLDWACQHYTAVDEFAGEIRTLVGVLHTVTGDIEDHPKHRGGIRCPRCDLINLWLMPDGHTECRVDKGGCGRLLREQDYREHVAELHNQRLEAA